MWIPAQSGFTPPCFATERQHIHLPGEVGPAGPGQLGNSGLVLPNHFVSQAHGYARLTVVGLESGDPGCGCGLATT